MRVSCRYLSIDLTDFNSSYLKKLSNNISKEQNSTFLLAHLSFNVLNYNEHNQTSEFLGCLTSNLLIQLILQ